MQPDGLAFFAFHLPNYVLAAIMYTMMARLVLMGFFTPDSQNYIWRGFVRVTDPVLALVRLVTPAAAPIALVLVFAALWMLVARVAYLVLMLQLGLLPTSGGGAS